jgi:hypothetical protein
MMRYKHDGVSGLLYIEGMAHGLHSGCTLQTGWCNMGGFSANDMPDSNRV